MRPLNIYIKNGTLALGKFRKCREKANGCQGKYIPWTSNIQRQGVCQNPPCLISKAAKNKAKADIKEKRGDALELKTRRNKLKTIKQLLAEAQIYCNKYIRTKYDGHGCYTCGESNPERQYQAGHFVSVGTGNNWAVRFHSDNLRLQCVRCNMYLGGNLVVYRGKLIGEIGLGRVEALENSQPYSFTREDALDIKAHFMELCRTIKKGGKNGTY